MPSKGGGRAVQNPMHAGAPQPQPEPEPEPEQVPGGALPSPDDGGGGRPAHSRDLFCRKRGQLSHSTCEDIANVTFLTSHEVKEVELVFLLLTRLVKEEGELQYVRRRSEEDHSHPALTTAQLRQYLPEFSQNEFLPRLVRLFSETGEQKLTLIELIDLYSALSRRAELKWKVTIAFCVFDYDEDGVLDKGDLFRTITGMLRGTTTSKTMTKEAAALRIQARHRGRTERKKDAEDIAPKAVAPPGASPGPIDSYAAQILQHCTSIRKDIMDFRFFETSMMATPGFRDNFCVTPSKHKELERRYNLFAAAGRPSLFQRCCRRSEKPKAGAVNNPMLGEMENPMHDDTEALECVENNQLMKNLEHKAKQAVAGSLTRRHFYASEIVVSRGEPGQEMYFIVDGTVEVLHNLESHPLGELGPGDHFGEVAVLNNDDRRTAFIRAKTEVEVFILTKEDLEIVIDEHDNVEAVIRAQMDSTLAEDPVRTEAQLWAKVDPREEGWILAKKGKNLLESVMTEKGMPLQAGSKKSKQKKKERTQDIASIVRQLMLASEFYENREEHLMDDDTSAIPPQPSKPRGMLGREAIARAAFHKWWQDQPHSSCVFTARRMRLEELWESLDNSGTGTLTIGEIRAVLYQMNSFTHADLDDDEFDEQVKQFFERWDTSNSGDLSLAEFSPWWVHQDPAAISQASLVDWDKVASDLRHKYDKQSNDDEKGASQFSVRMRQMDTELSDLQERLDGGDDKLLDDDYDSARSKAFLKDHGGSMPFGMHGAVRPPMVAVRLKQFRKLAKRGEAKDLADVEHRREHWRFMKTIETVGSHDNEEVETVGELLGMYSGTSSSCSLTSCLWLKDLKLWLKTFVAEAHIGLWSTTLMCIEHEFGHGMAEVMKIMKWMLLLNVWLALIWFVLVILPRDVSVDHDLWNATLVVLRGLAFEESGGQRSLFYDGYAKVPVNFLGIPLRMDVLYFVAILANVLFSLFAILRTLGLNLTHLAQGSALSVKGETDFTAILGSYDCTVTGESHALEMRQGIRYKLEQYLMHREELQRAKELSDNKLKECKHLARLYTGKAVTALLLVIHVGLLVHVLKFEQQLNKTSSLIAPLMISILNGLMPKVISVIVKREDHLTGHDVLHSYMQRVYIVKMIQLAVILYSMAKIMTATQAKQEIGETEQADELGLLNEFFSASDVDECDPSNAIAGCACAEARMGAIFFRLVLTDAFVFIGAQLFAHYACVHGLPRFWKWRSVVRHFGKGPEAPTEEARKRGYRLQCRHFEVPKQTLSQHLHNHTHSRRKRKKTWWKLVRTQDENVVFNKLSVRDWVKGVDCTDVGLEGIGASESQAIAMCLMDAKFERAEQISKKLRHSSGDSSEQLAQIIEKRRDGRDGRWTKCNTDGRFQVLKKVSNQALQAFAQKLINNEGHWTEVTGTVNALRLWKMKPAEFTNFKSALLMIDMMYRQAFVWVGSTWCPWLPVVALITQVAMFSTLQRAMLGGAYRRPAEPWSAEQTFRIFMLHALGTLAITCLPILVWLNRAPDCGPHAPTPNEEGEIERSKVFETFGVYLDDLPPDHILNGEFSVIMGILLNPPCLIIMIFVLWTRFRYVSTKLKSKELHVEKVEKAYRTEKKFLTSRLQDMTTKSGDTEEDLLTTQARYERVMSELDQEHLDSIVKNMGKGRTNVLDQDLDGHMSATEMQAWAELAATIDSDNNGHLEGDENLMWCQSIMQNTCWLGNIYPSEATEKYLRQRLLTLDGDAKCVILACTLCKYNHKEEKKLNKESPDSRGLQYRSWCLVTFMHESSKDAVLRAYPFSAAKPTASGSAGRRVKDGWVAASWEEAKHFDVPQLQGEIDGSVSPRSPTSPSYVPDPADESDDEIATPAPEPEPQETASPIVLKHNKTLHKALQVALGLRTQIDDVHKEVMGEEDDDDDDFLGAED